MSINIYLSTTVDLGGPEPIRFGYFDANITHNVVPMWKLAGCYDALYNSDGKKAEEITPDLLKAVMDMTARPHEYKKLDSPNGWGTYEHALKFLREVLVACQRVPLAKIEVSK